MLRYPMHGFAKRADETVAKAMAIIRAKEARMIIPPLGSASAPGRD